MMVTSSRRTRKTRRWFLCFAMGIGLTRISRISQIFFVLRDDGYGLSQNSQTF